MDNRIQYDTGSFETQTHHSIKWLKFIFYICLELIIVVISIYVGIQMGIKKNVPSQQCIVKQEVVTPKPTIEDVFNPSVDLPEGWSRYVNKEVGISFDYPPGWRLREPTVEILQVDLSPPESSVDSPFASVSFYTYNQPYLPEPTPSLCMTGYTPYLINNNLQGRKTENEQSSAKCLRTGGCFPKAEIELPLKNSTLVVNYCLEDKNRIEEIIKTIKIVQ